MEFNYMILQAYDFYKLNKQHDCDLQIGGSDQWGNIISGVELIRKMNQKESFGLTTPLITVASGAKMGKTENGAIWLDEELLSPYDYWQFWRNTSDSDVKKFLRYFTEINIEKLDEISKDENINNLKILLANEATKLLHGEEKANDAEKTAEETFNDKGIGKNLPETFIDKSQFKNGINIIELLYVNKIMSSKSEIRRAINERGIKINDKLIVSEKIIIELKNFKENGCLKVSRGKKKHFIIRLK
jgi:tyrosyl-tRNA synthetase